MSDPVLRERYEIGRHFRLTMDQMEQMPVSEYIRWQQIFREKR